MRKNKILMRALSAVFVCGLFFGCMNTVRVNAASAAIDFSCSAQTIHVGDIFTVNLEISADVEPGAFEGYISYNDNVLEYVTGPECMAGGEGILRVMDDGIDGGLQLARKYVMYFKAVKIGSCDISMRGTPEVYEAELGYLMSVSSGVLTLDVQPDVKASSDASLATIKVHTGTLEPAFQPDIHEYNLNVANDVTTVIVSAVANDSEASVKIEGNTHLVVGQNRVMILVTAEDGTVEKYVIYVVREKAEQNGSEDSGENTDSENAGAASDSDSQAGEAQESAPGTGNSKTDGEGNGFSFYAAETDGNVILSSSSRYTVCRNDGSVTIPDGYYRTSVIVSGYTVTAYSPDEDLSSDYLLLILSRDGGKPGLYSFDRVEKTVQRYNPDGAGFSASGQENKNNGEQQLIDGYEKSISNMTVIISVLCGICMLLLIISVRSSVRAGRAEHELEAGRGRRSTRNSDTSAGRGSRQQNNSGRRR